MQTCDWGSRVPRSWVFRRAVAQRLMLLALFALLTFLTFAVSVVAGGASAQRSGIIDSLALAAPAARATQISLPLGDDPSSQTSAAGRLFAATFPGGVVDVIRTVAAGPYVAAAGGGAGPVSVGLRSYPDLGAHVTVVSGRLPAVGVGPLTVGMSTAAASALHISVGGHLTLQLDAGPVDAQVVGLFTYRQPADPLFYEGEINPVAAISAPEMAALQGSKAVRWTFTPDPDRFDPARIGSLIAAVTDLRRTVNNDVQINAGSPVQYGDLSSTLIGIAGALDAARSVSVIPLLLVAVLGSLLLVELMVILQSGRRPEFALMRSRGVGPGRLLAGSLAEAVALGVPAVLLGLWFAALSAHGLGGASALSAGGGVFLVGVVAAAVVTAREVAGRVRPSMRSRFLGLWMPLALLLVAAALSLARFRRLGAATVAGSDGSVKVDPVAVLAPPLLLVAAAVFATGLAAVIVRLVTRMLSGRRGVAVLPCWEVGRRWPLFAMVNVVVIAAVAIALSAAAFDSTFNRFSAQMAVLGNGADVRVEFPNITDVSSGEPDLAGRIVPVAGGTNVLVTGTTSGNVTSELTALAATRMGSILPSVPGGFDGAAAAAVLGRSDIGLALPNTAHRLDLTVAVSAKPENVGGVQGYPSSEPSLTLEVWLAAGDGRVVPVELGSATGAGRSGGTARTTLHADLPIDGSGSWRLVAVDATGDGAGNAIYSVDVTAITTDLGPVAADPTIVWAVQPVDLLVDPPHLSARPAGQIGWSGELPSNPTPAPVRLMPASTASASVPVPVPVVVNQAAAQQFAAGVGSPLDLQLSATSRHITTVVASVSPELPGPATGPAALADLGSVLISLLRTTSALPATNQVWLNSPTPDVTADDIRTAGPPGITVVPVASGFAEPLLQPVKTAFGQAALASLLLAVLALAALAAALFRRRPGEARVLGAMGVAPAQQARQRSTEIGISVAWSVLLGIPVGLISADATVPYLARSALISRSSLLPGLSVAPSVIALLAAAVFAQLLVAAAAGWWTLRSARPGADPTGVIG